MRHLTSLFDLTTEEVHEILDLSATLKTRFRENDRPSLLKNHVIAQVFEKPSLRTRNSFEASMIQLGGDGIFLTCKEAGLDGRESVADVARVLSGYSDTITMRTFSQELIEEFAEYSRCPVINALSDERHPCQGLTDMLTLSEFLGDLEGKTLAFIGDGNNVAKSLAIATSHTRMNFVVAAPKDYELSQSFLGEVSDRVPGGNVRQTQDPFDAVTEADVIYTDVWASMGQEAESAKRKQDFAGFCVDSQLMAAAPEGCRFMHDLPAKRGLEVSDEVMDGPHSIVFEQAENRMHLAKGLLVWLMTEATERRKIPRTGSFSQSDQQVSSA